MSRPPQHPEPGTAGPRQDDPLPPRGPVRTRMLRAVARLLFEQERRDRRLQRMREVDR